MKVSTAAIGLDMPDNMKFWEWVLSEKAKRHKLSYQKMVDAGKRQGVSLDRSAIVKAIAHNSTPSPEMIRMIAAAFDMSPDEVEVQLGRKVRVSQDVIENRPLLLKILINGQQMSDDALEVILAQQEAVLAQMRRKPKNGGKTAKSR